MTDRSWRRYKNYIFLLPIFAAALFYQITYCVVAINVAAHGMNIPENPFTTNGRNVRGVDSDAANAGLGRGDRILTIDGRDFAGENVMFEQIRSHKPHQMLVLNVVPKGKQAVTTLRVPIRANSDSPPDAGDWALGTVLVGTMLFCALVGIYVAAILPNDKRALMLLGLMISLSQLIKSAQWYNFPRPLWEFADAWAVGATVSWSVWLIAFALYFPERFNWDLRRPWLKWVALGPLLLWTAEVVVASVSAHWNYRTFAWLNHALDKPLLNSPGAAIGAAVAFFCVSLGVKAATAKSRDAKRRLRILLAGSAIGLGPLGLLILYQSLAETNEFNGVSQSIVVAVCLLFCLFPLTLAYVIVVDRAMDLRMVIRQGMRYALARTGLRVLITAVAVLLFWLLNVLVWGSRASLPLKISTAVAAVVALNIVIRRTRRRLQLGLDRRYFRDAYQSEVILEELSENVRSVVDERQLLETVLRRISDALHVENINILLNSGGIFRPAYSLAGDLPPQASLLEDSSTVKVLKDSKEPAPIYFDREDNWVHQTPEAELTTLKAMNSQLLLPLGFRNKLLGIFSLGPKRSEEPYSRTDVQLLRSVATQTGLALENSRLTIEVAKEMAQRESLNREIEIAREVQERLFPQRLPAIVGLDFSGACRPAQGVGGDYYDFLTLANGDLGIAIGDVSGKGIAAALLMASLQASLRGQAMIGQTDLAKLMSNVNQLVFDATPINRYATFFYGQYNRESRIFTYVNAGHNPPMVLRKAPDGTVHVIRLETGGPVVGLFPNAPYQQGSLILEKGDIFVGFTDGISEAMNNEDEEWGEERLIPAVEAAAGQDAADMIPALMAQADEFASGAPQHDDMTLVVMKMSEAETSSGLPC